MNRLTVSPQAAAAGYNAIVERFGTPVLVLDRQIIREQYASLARALPGVRFFYAIKSLPHPAIVETLAAAGSSFDIATTGEINLIQALGVRGRSTIHTHPIKRDQDIRAALRFGCTTFVVDNPDELTKLLPYRGRVGLLLRVGFRNPGATVDLAKKFGCAVEETEVLIEAAKSLGLHIKGISFHVGSQCDTSNAHVLAIDLCRDFLARHTGLNGAPLSVLDIGGGFPVPYSDAVDDIDTFCAPIREALAKLPSDIDVWAEPGRFISAPAMRSISRVIGKATRGERIWYYLDDGVYGAYSGQIFDHASYPLECFTDTGERITGVLAGPTCDSIDVIAESIELPPLGIGDLVVGHMMGAYTIATATEFNSFPKPPVITIDSAIASEAA